MQLPIPKDTLVTVNISPDTLKTLETGTYTGIQNITNSTGYGYVSLIDADKDITREYEIQSETYSLSYTLPGATLFRGQFSFSGLSISGQIRIPEDISYSPKPAKLLIYINDEQNEARAVINTIQLAGGEATTDNFGPQISFENMNGTRLEANDHLIENDQENASTYKANLKKALKDLDKLTKKVKSELNKDFKSIVFHDAYQYFEKRFDVNVLGAFTVNTDVLPGAEQLSEIREIIEHDKVSCVFSEPQFNPDIINAVAKDMNIKTGVLDPLGATLTPGKTLYFDLISNMSKSFKSC